MIPNKQSTTQPHQIYGPPSYSAMGSKIIKKIQAYPFFDFGIACFFQNSNTPCRSADILFQSFLDFFCFTFSEKANIKKKTNSHKRFLATA